MTPQEYWSSDQRSRIHTQLAQGRWPDQCSQCREDESQGRQSLRQWGNARYSHRRPLDDQPRYVDLRLSNECNLRCRMCDPRYSAGISAELHRHDLQEFYPTESLTHKLEVIQPSHLDEIRRWLPQIDRLQFTGGEPTQIAGVRDVIEEMIHQGHATRCDLLITTNATRVDAWWLDLVNHFQSVHFTVSMDGVGETFEYIRHGADWSRFCANVQQIIRAVSSLQINSVMSAYTIPTLTDQCRTVREWQLQHRSLHPRGHFAWTMPVIHEPAQLRCWVYPRMYRRVLENEIRNAVSMCDQWHMTAVAESARSVIAQFESQPESPEQWDKFARYTGALDRIRHARHTLSWHHMFG
jgi:sulfatase maturation enzyme AslB (radical SAM superfamily)